jgi:hypothetical protein
MTKMLFEPISAQSLHVSQKGSLANLFENSNNGYPIAVGPTFRTPMTVPVIAVEMSLC